MGFLKNVKRGIVTGGLVGALVGGQYGSVREAYKDVLYADIQQKKAVVEYVKDNRKTYDKTTYRVKLEEVKEEYNLAKDKLNEYKSLPEDKKKKEALTDIMNYGMTIKNLPDHLGLPKTKEGVKGAGKGALYGAGTGAVLLVGLSRRKKKSKGGLESRVAIFLGLLAGGAGISLISTNLSKNITGNVIGGLTQTKGILGIVLLIVGIIGAYFYFKE